MITTDQILKAAELAKEALELFEAGAKAFHDAHAKGTAKINEAKSLLAAFEDKIAAGDKAIDDEIDRRFDK